MKGFFAKFGFSCYVIISSFMLVKLLGGYSLSWLDRFFSAIAIGLATLFIFDKRGE